MPIPSAISNEEDLTHAIFSSDLKGSRPPYRVRLQSFLPPAKPDMPSADVSFNRACYLPDQDQKALALLIPRGGATFKGYVRLTRTILHHTIAELRREAIQEGSQFTLNAEFIYTPLFLAPPQYIEWPAETPQEWGKGFNAAHCDLHYSEMLYRDEPNKEYVQIAEALAKLDEAFILEEVSEFSNPKQWNGPPLCRQ
jgi:hypothetical protein